MLRSGETVNLLEFTSTSSILTKHLSFQKEFYNILGM